MVKYSCVHNYSFNDLCVGHVGAPVDNVEVSLIDAPEEHIQMVIN